MAGGLCVGLAFGSCVGLVLVYRVFMLTTYMLIWILMGVFVCGAWSFGWLWLYVAPFEIDAQIRKKLHSLWRRVRGFVGRLRERFRD